MKNPLIYFTIFILFGVPFLFPFEAFSQGSMSMQVLQSHIEENEPFEIAITTVNLKGHFIIPEEQNIKFLRQIADNESSSISNTGSDYRHERVFLAVATRTGRITIPPARIRKGLKIYKSNPLTINVSPSRPQQSPNRHRQSGGVTISLGPNGVKLKRNSGSSSPDPSSTNAPKYKPIDPKELIFIRTQLDKNTAYVGEQIVATTKIYYKVQFESNSVKLPKYTGFYSEPVDVGNPMENVSQERINGQDYLVMTISRDILFPQKSGKLSISPVSLDCYAQIPVLPSEGQQSNPFGELFDDFNLPPQFQQMLQDSRAMFNQLEYEMKPLHLTSAAQTVNVLPSPMDSLGRYYSVGIYQMTSRLQRSHITQDDVDTLVVTILGTGNPAFIQVPTWSNPYLDLISIKEVDSITSRYPVLKGYKRIYYLFSSNTTGEVEIQPMYFSYFNPQSKENIQLRTDGYKLQVDPGKKLSKDEAIAIMRPSDIENKSEVQDDYLWLESPAAWSMWLLPMLAFSGLVYVRKRKEDRETVRESQKDLIARKVALKRLSTAKEYLDHQNTEAFYQEISKALWLYISDKSGIPLSKISKQSANDWLSQKNISDKLHQDFDRLVSKTELMLYAHGNENQVLASDFDEAKELISSLEKSIDQKKTA